MRSSRQMLNWGLPLAEWGTEVLPCQWEMSYIPPGGLAGLCEATLGRCQA